MGRGRRRGKRKDVVRVEISVHPDVVMDDAALVERAAKKAGLRPADVRRVRWVRRSIDARAKPGGIASVRIACVLDLVLGLGVDDPPAPRPIAFPSPKGTAPQVVIVGAGPGGLFCAHRLASVGIPSVILERGKAVRARRHDLAALMQRGELDPESNYCFGEGGAGTFSDGKLYTRSAKRGDARHVLETFVAYGATADILVDARPHIGTNRLPQVIGSMRAHLESAGVAVRFSTRVDRLLVGDGRVQGVECADGSRVPARAVVLATGHSARNVLEFVADAGGRLSRKPFAMGVRVEHPQALIDQIQFGALAGHPALGSAAYRLVERVGEVGVYSFCMCPGGFAVPASTVVGAQVVNGWSPASRRGRFANSGFVVEVDAAMLAAAGLDPADVRAGLDMQDALEVRAYGAGGGEYRAPAQRLADLVEGRPSTDLPESSYPRGITPARLDELLGPLGAPLRAALQTVGERMPGWLGPDAIALGVESRTSSPVRVDRVDASLEAVGIDGLYPAAEGAGYAGGIMSAALDGIRVADAIAREVGASDARPPVGRPPR